MSLTSSGRPKRRTRRAVDYKERDGDTPYDLEKYLERVRKEQEERSPPTPRTSAQNLVPS